MSMQYLSSSIILAMPRTWPSMRRIRLRYASLFAVYPCIVSLPDPFRRAYPGRVLSTAQSIAKGPVMSDTNRTSTYTVTGMTCEHCVNAVTEEVGTVDGVDAVAVDLESGHVTVSGAGYTDEQIAAAVDEAGYSL